MKIKRITAVAAVTMLLSTGAVQAHQHCGGHGQPHCPDHQQGQAQSQQRGPAETQQRGRRSMTNMEQQKIRRSMQDDEIYGRQMMTSQERNEYRNRLNSAASDKEWAQIREEHQIEMQARAAAQGRQLEKPVYGQYMLTTEERNAYIRRLNSATTDAERSRIQNEHRVMISERAIQLGMAPPDA